jgi:tetratricopeptide (TPR) repeat protein
MVACVPLVLRLYSAYIPLVLRWCRSIGAGKLHKKSGRGCFRLANEVEGFTVAMMTATGSAPSRTRRCLSMPRLSPLCLLVAVLAGGSACHAAEVSTASPRLTVAVLTFEDQTGDPEAAHWRYMIERLLTEGLAEASAFRRVPAVFGYRQLKLKRGDAISAEQARQIGELVEARRVVWGAYRWEGGKWLVTARVLNVASGVTSAELKAASADWYEVRDQLADQVMKELGVTPTEAEHQKMLRRGTGSASALEWYSRTLAGQEERKPKPEQETIIRKALDADPQYADAYGALAAALGSQGKFPLAEEAARRGVELRPDGARLHLALSFTLMFQGNLAQAEKELHEAVRLNPDDAEAFMRLGECAKERGKLDDAITFWNEAKRLDPTDAGVRAHLGNAYAKKRDRERALRELKEAERLDPDGMNSEQIIWQGYVALHETPLALEHLEKFVALARKAGLAPKMVDYTEECGRELKARLVPSEVVAAMPTVYTRQSLDAALRQRLTSAEYKLVVNPIASTPAMDLWAQELTRGATNDLDRARKIFNALARHLDTGETGTRTAQEVFAVWNDPAQSFCCQEYAKLYIALARAVGLKAFYVHLEKDYSGEIVYHDCAAVFIGDKTLLVDPAYQWFGAPHKEYVVLDDVQAIAHHFYQPSAKGQGVTRCRLAAKLHPNTAWGQLHLVGALLKANEFDEARKVLKNAQKLEPGRWDCCTYQGFLAAKTGDLNGAAASLRKALELNPQHGPTHLILGWVLCQQNKLEAARDEYRLAVLYDTMLSSEEKTAALRAIAEINERLPGK